MRSVKTITPACLLPLLLSIGGCADAEPGAVAAGSVSATPSVSSSPSSSIASSSAATPTPTPSPSVESLGPAGTAVVRDGKVWLVSADGTYTIDIAEGFYFDEWAVSAESPVVLQSSQNGEAEIHVSPRLDRSKVPSRKEIEMALASSLTNEPQIRDDLNEFAGGSAITTQFKLLGSTRYGEPDYDGTILSTFTEIGGSVWAFSFTDSTREDAEALMKQAADSLQKH